MADAYARVSGNVGVCLASCQFDPVMPGGTSHAAGDGPCLWSFGTRSPPESGAPRDSPEVEANRDSSRWRPYFDMLLSSSRPLLVLGTGARRAFADPSAVDAVERRLGRLIEVLERHALPVATSPRAKGIFPESHPMSLGCLGVVGNRWSQHYLSSGLRALVVLGSRWGALGHTASDGPQLPRGHLIRVDASASDARGMEPGVTSVCADAAEFIDAFIEHAVSAAPGPAIRRRRQALLQSTTRGARWGDGAARASLAMPLKPQRVMSELQAVLNHHDACRWGVNLFCELGAGLGWAWEHLVLDPPHRFWCSTRPKANGWATSAVIGGKLADPERPAIALLGADALLVHGREISAAVRQRVGAVWLILCESSRIPEPVPAIGEQVEAFAETLGARVHHLDRPGAVARGLGEALATATANAEPQVLLVRVDADEAPASSYPLLRRSRVN